MKLREQLRRLEEERDRELHAAVIDYARLKREASPDRYLRRHLGAALITAGILGMIFAPGPRREGRTRSGGRRRILRGVQWILRRLQEKQPAPEQVEAPAPSPDQKATPPGGLFASVLDLLPAFAAQLNWEAIFQALVAGLKDRSTADADNGETPAAGVAEVHNGQPQDAPSEAESP